MDADEKVPVIIDGVIHIFAKSDITLIELFTNRTGKVVVDYASERYEGIVSPKTARQFDGYSSHEQATRWLVDAVAEEEVEKEFMAVVAHCEELRKFNESKSSKTSQDRFQD